MKSLSYNEIIFHIQKPNIRWCLCQTFERMTITTVTQSFDIRRGDELFLAYYEATIRRESYTNIGSNDLFP